MSYFIAQSCIALSCLHNLSRPALSVLYRVACCVKLDLHWLVFSCPTLLCLFWFAFHSFVLYNVVLSYIILACRTLFYLPLYCFVSFVLHCTASSFLVLAFFVLSFLIALHCIALSQFVKFCLMCHVKSHRPFFLFVCS